MIALELLGKDLEFIKDTYCNGTFSLKTTLMLADQIVSIIEYCNSRGVIHRDIQPQNFCMGLDNNFFHVHLTNFERSKILKSDNQNELVQESESDSEEFVGDPMFTSIAYHNMEELSVKDDLESLIYMMLFMMTGSLPWSNLLVDSQLSEEEVMDGICDLKKEFVDSQYWETAIVKLTPSENEAVVEIPKAIHDIYTNLRALKTDQSPNFSEIKSSLKEALVSRFLEYDYIYDWILIPASAKIAKDFGSIDNVIDTDKEFSLKEENLIQRMIKEYEDDPTLINTKLENIKREVQKFEVIKVNKKEALKKGKKKGKNVLGQKGKSEKKDKCSLI